MTLWRRLRPYRTTLLLVVCALVAAVLFLLDRSRITTDEKDARRHNLLPAWREADIRRVDVRSGGEHFALVRASSDEDGGPPADWELARGDRRLDADQQSVAQWLSTLEFATYRRVAQGTDPGLGLDEPAMSLAIEMGAVSLAIAVGAEVPTEEGARYAAVAVNDEPRQLYVVSPQLYSALREGLAALPARQLSPYLSLDLAAIAFESAGARWQLVRGGWQGRDGASFAVLRGETKVRASRAGVDRLLGALVRLEADKLIDVAEPPSSPSRFALVLRPAGEGRPEARLLVGGACPGGAAGVQVVRTAPRPLAGCVAEAVVAELELREADLVDRHLVGATPEELVEVVLADSTRRVELARRDEGWHMRAPVDSQLEADVVDGRLDALVAAEGELVAGDAELGPLGLDPPAATARLTSRGRGGVERVETLALGAVREGRVVVRRAEDGALLSLDAASARPLWPSAETLRSLSVFTVELRWFRGLRVESKAVRQALARDANGAWTLVAPKLERLRADPGLASELAERLGQLRAVSWVADRAEPAMALEEPWCRVEADVAEEGAPDGPPRKIGVALGAPTEGGYFARHDGDPAVFVAPKGLGDMAQRWLLDRAALLVEMERIEGVELRHGAAELALQRQGGKLRVASGPNKTEAAALAVEEALRALMAEGVVHLGAPDASEGFGTPTLVVEVSLGRDGDAPATRVRFDVGAGDTWRETSVFWLRRSDVDATFAVAQSRLRPLLELF